MVPRRTSSMAVTVTVCVAVGRGRDVSDPARPPSRGLVVDLVARVFAYVILPIYRSNLTRKHGDLPLHPIKGGQKGRKGKDRYDHRINNHITHRQQPPTSTLANSTLDDHSSSFSFIYTPGQKFLATDHFERHRSDNPHRHSDRRPPGERVININRSSNSLEIHVDINHVTRGQHEHV